jgi:hypothetical protein
MASRPSDARPAPPRLPQAGGTERAKRRAEARMDRACEVCGAPLAAERSTAKFCGPTCRSKAWRAVQR